MPNPIPGNIVALFDAMTMEALDALRPVDRERFMQRCRHWAELAAQPRGAAKREPKATVVVFQKAAEATRKLAEGQPRTVGVLAQLRNGERVEDCDELRCVRP